MSAFCIWCLYSRYIDYYYTSFMDEMAINSFKKIYKYSAKWWMVYYHNLMCNWNFFFIHDEFDNVHNVIPVMTRNKPMIISILEIK